MRRHSAKALIVDLLSLLAALALLGTLGWAYFTRELCPLLGALAYTAFCCWAFGGADAKSPPPAKGTGAQGGA